MRFREQWLKWAFVLTVSLASGFTAAAESMVLVLGDSLSAGYGLPTGKGWVVLLSERMGREAPGFKVVNASISGDTTHGGRTRLAPLLERHRPVVVVVELGANDGLRGTDLGLTREHLSAIVTASKTAGARVLVIGMRIPPNYGPDYTRRFHALFGEVAQASQSGLVPFLMEGFAERRELFQDDGIHPGMSAQPLMLDNVWPKLAPLLKTTGTKSR
jgi:acyl-CoA thioesterase-1